MSPGDEKNQTGDKDTFMISEENKNTGGPNPAVILGLSPGGLFLVRCLSEAGIPVYGVSRGKESGRFSKYLTGDRCWDCPMDEDLLEKIAEAGIRHGSRPLLLPCSDRYIEWISKHYDDLMKTALFSGTYHPGRYGQLLDKDLFYRICEENGVPYPRRWKLEDLSSLSGGSGSGSVSAGEEYNPESLPYPILIKPGRLHEVTDVMGSRKVFICRSREELERIGGKLPLQRGGWLVQEIVEGPDDQIYCIGGVHTGDGAVKARISGRKLRQFPAGFGTAAALLLEEAPEELWDYTRSLLKALKLDGIFEIEFKLDRKDGVWKVFEINPRTALWFGAARTAGIPLAETLYCFHAGVTPPSADSGTGLGASEELRIIWRSGLKNFIALGMHALRGRRGKKYPRRNRSADRLEHLPAERPANGPKHKRAAATWAFWEAADPFPLYMELISYFRKVLLKLLKILKKAGKTT